MSEAVLLLPQYAFMAWCLVKAQGQPYLYLPKHHAVKAYRSSYRVTGCITSWLTRLREVQNRRYKKSYNAIHPVPHGFESLYGLRRSSCGMRPLTAAWCFHHFIGVESPFGYLGNGKAALGLSTGITMW